MTDETNKENSSGLVTYEPGSIVPLNHFSQYVKQVKLDLTDKNYIFYKNGLAFVDAAYTDEKFQKYYPLFEQKFAYIKEDVYWVTMLIELSVILQNGLKVTRIGAGGARKQVLKKAKEEFEKTGKPITPFDYVDNSFAIKSATTNCVKNAQERFGINADICNRIIMESYQVDEARKAISKIIEHFKTKDPMAASRMVDKLASNDMKHPKKLVDWLIQLAQYFHLNLEEDLDSQLI